MMFIDIARRGVSATTLFLSLPSLFIITYLTK